MKIKLQLLLCTVLLANVITAQELSIDLDFRDRFEYRHGFNNLVPQGADPAAFVQQRARLKFGYTSEKFKAHFSIQDVRVWGDTRQILDNDANNNLQVAEAWASLAFGKGWSTKVGRQMISYDDQRILGGLDWALQGRFHDLALIRYGNEKIKLDLGFAFSQNDLDALPGNQTGTIYNVTGFFSYKAMEYAHLTWKASEKATLSFLALNNTFQNVINGTPTDGFYHTHTFGTHSKFKLGGVGLALNAYLQAGEGPDTTDPASPSTDLSAYLVGLEANGKIGAVGIGGGFEIQSGTDQNETDGKNYSFFPLYGTNHKFNGYMDYFYVGNHANSVGLTDIYAKANFKFGKSSSLLVKGHYFSSAATLIDDTDGSEADKYLGTEVDIVFTQKLLPYASVKVGYSQMFAGEGMEFLKNQPNPSGLQNWGWVQLVIKPNFLKWSPKPLQ
ncbi:alginate export family protein [uncultured Aquimarina sp.]|uniref:alginate export family protein n=1 Tax=uncultured Aquimarina sp. TaxID=575652 RepID=UPI00260C7B55|nr:alginate export family protein [uncultured Aquimarina sp.]